MYMYDFEAYFVCVHQLALTDWLSYYHPRANIQPPTITSPPPPSLNSPVSLLPPICQPLPDIFTGVVAYLHGYMEQEERTRGRYLVAYNGDVCSAIGSSTTHVICKAGSKVSVTGFCSNCSPPHNGDPNSGFTCKIFYSGFGF